MTPDEPGPAIVRLEVICGRALVRVMFPPIPNVIVREPPKDSA